MTGKLVILLLVVVGVNFIQGQDDRGLCDGQGQDGRGRGDEIVEVERHFDFRELIQRHGRRRPFPRDTVDEGVALETNVPAEGLDTVLRWLRTEDVGDSGHTTNCGGSNMEVSWTPKDISRSGSLSVSMDGTAATDLSTAKVTAKVTVGIFSKTITQTMTCDQMKQQYPQLKCPIKKGDSLKASTSIPSLAQYKLPEKTLEVEAKIDNENGEEFACLRAKVKIVN